MSETEISGRSARRFNDRAAHRIGWVGQFRDEDVALFTGLGSPPSSAEFYKAVVELQEWLRSSGYPIEIDGFLGYETWHAYLTHTQPIFSGASALDHFVHGDRKYRIPENRAFDAITYYHPGGLDLRNSGYKKTTFMNNSRKIDYIILHWGGYDAEHCSRVLRNRNLSSHFGVQRDVVYQWLDTQHIAYHATGANENSLGIDICRSPLRSMQHRYAHEVPRPRMLKNTTGRGLEEYLELDAYSVATTRSLVKILCERFEVPFVCPRKPNGDYNHSYIPKSEWRGVLGHHHVSATKWDIAPWWASIFDGSGIG